VHFDRLILGLILMPIALAVYGLVRLCRWLFGGRLTVAVVHTFSPTIAGSGLRLGNRSGLPPARCTGQLKRTKKARQGC
jgi:hypothetical protein